MGERHSSSTRAGAKLTAACKRYYPWTCHLCGYAIPRTAPSGHPQSFEADHLADHHGNPHLRLVLSNLRPSHKICNQWRSRRPISNGLRSEIRTRYAARFLQRPAMSFFAVGVDQGKGEGVTTGQRSRSGATSPRS